MATKKKGELQKWVGLQKRRAVRKVKAEAKETAMEALMGVVHFAQTAYRTFDEFGEGPEALPEPRTPSPAERHEMLMTKFHKKQAQERTMRLQKVQKVRR
jgi:hypothetical protein